MFSPRQNGRLHVFMCVCVCVFAFRDAAITASLSDTSPSEGRSACSVSCVVADLTDPFLTQATLELQGARFVLLQVFRVVPQVFGSFSSASSAAWPA